MDLIQGEGHRGDEVGALGKTQVPERDGHKVEVDDAFVAIARFENGAIGTIEGSRIACGYGHTGRIQVDGTKGSLKFDVERLNELEIADGIGAGFRTIQAIRAGHPFADFWFDGGIQGSHPIGWSKCFVHQVHHLLTAIAGGSSVAPLAATFEDGYRAAEVCEAMGRSWRSGRGEPVQYQRLASKPAPNGRLAVAALEVDHPKPGKEARPARGRSHRHAQRNQRTRLAGAARILVRSARRGSLCVPWHAW